MRARVVVNAAGVWSDEVRALDEGAHPDSIRPAKGVHLTMPWEKVSNDIAVVIPVPKDKRSLFVVPWGDFTPTSAPPTPTTRGPIDDPQCTQDDIDYVLRALNHSVTTGVTEADVTGTWAGLRPLVKRGRRPGRTADLSRLHQVAASRQRLISVTGGKLTTYRRMAADTVDLAMDRLDRRRPVEDQAPALCWAPTGYEEPAGTTGRPTCSAATARWPARSRRSSTADAALAEPLVPGLPYVARGGRLRGPSRDGPLGGRRAVPPHAGPPARPGRHRRGRGRVARLLAPELGWSDADVEREAAAYRRSVEHEVAAGRDASDQALDAAFGA